MSVVRAGSHPVTIQRFIAAIVVAILATLVVVGAGKVMAATAKKTKCLEGQVVSMAMLAKGPLKGKEGRLTVKFERGTGKAKKLINQPISVTKAQFDNAAARSVRRGSPVKVCTTGQFNGKVTKLTGNVLNLAPKGQEATYGGVDGGSSSDSGTSGGS